MRSTSIDGMIGVFLYFCCDVMVAKTYISMREILKVIIKVMFLL